MIRSIYNKKNEIGKLPLLLRIVAVEHRQEQIFRPGGVKFHQWLYCKKGTGEVQIGSAKYRAEEGGAFLIRAYDVHQYRPLSEEWILYIIGFDAEASEPVMRTLGMESSGIYTVSSPEAFTERIREIYELTEENGRGKKKQYAERLFSFLLAVSDGINKIRGEASLSESDMVNDVLLYIEEHYMENIAVSDIALQAGKTPEYLSGVFKKETGKTIIAYLTEVRMIHARILLGQSLDLTIQEIARECGFQSQSYFGKVFRDTYQMTPNEYRLYAGRF